MWAHCTAPPPPGQRRWPTSSTREEVGACKTSTYCMAPLTSQTATLLHRNREVGANTHPLPGGEGRRDEGAAGRGEGCRNRQAGALLGRIRNAGLPLLPASVAGRPPPQGGWWVSAGSRRIAERNCLKECKSLRFEQTQRDGFVIRHGPRRLPEDDTRHPRHTRRCAKILDDRLRQPIQKRKSQKSWGAIPRRSLFLPL